MHGVLKCFVFSLSNFLLAFLFSLSLCETLAAFTRTDNSVPLTEDSKATELKIPAHSDYKNVKMDGSFSQY